MVLGKDKQIAMREAKRQMRHPPRDHPLHQNFNKKNRFSQQELDRVLLSIKQRFPHLNILRLMQNLYINKQEILKKAIEYEKRLRKQSRVEGDQEGFQERKYCQFLYKVDLRKFKVGDKACIRITRVVHNLSTEAQRQAFQQKRKVALTFVYSGYGLKVYSIANKKQNLGLDLNLLQYKYLMHCIAAQSFRFLIQLLKDCLRQQFKSPDKTEARLVLTILYNCRIMFRERCEDYLKLIACLFGINQEPCDFQIRHLQELNNVIWARLQIRMKDMLTDKENLQKKMSKGREPQEEISSKRDKVIMTCWTPNKQRQLLQWYIQVKTFTKIREKYRSKYGAFTMFQNCDNIRKKIFTCLKRTMKRVQRMVGHNLSAFQHLLYDIWPITQQKMRIVLTSQAGMKVRLELAQFELGEDISQHRVSEILKQMGKILKSQKPIFQTQISDKDCDLQDLF